MPFISVTPQLLLQVAPMQISATLQTQTDENETRWNDVTGTFLLSLSGLFSVQELSFNIRVFFRQSKVLLDAYLKKTKLVHILDLCVKSVSNCTLLMI